MIYIIISISALALVGLIGIIVEGGYQDDGWND